MKSFYTRLLRLIDRLYPVFRISGTDDRLSLLPMSWYQGD